MLSNAHSYIIAIKMKAINNHTHRHSRCSSFESNYSLKSKPAVYLKDIHLSEAVLNIISKGQITVAVAVPSFVWQN